MKLLKYLSVFCLLSTSTSALAVMEIDGDFGYEKTVFGPNRENSLVSRSYAGSLAVYFTQHLGIELNYSRSRELTTIDEDRATTSNSIVLSSSQNRVDRSVYGVGLRISLGGRKSFIQPAISLGYARSFSESSYSLTYNDNNGSQIGVIQSDVSKARSDNAFGTFALKFRLTRGLSIKGSVRTYFPADDFDKAKDNLKYAAGFSWMF